MILVKILYIILFICLIPIGFLAIMFFKFNMIVKRDLNSIEIYGYVTDQLTLEECFSERGYEVTENEDSVILFQADDRWLIRFNHKLLSKKEIIVYVLCEEISYLSNEFNFPGETWDILSNIVDKTIDKLYDKNYKEI